MMSLENAVSELRAKPAEFNLIHFRDVTHGQGAPPHYWVAISIGNNQHILLSIVTSQMQKLAHRYLNYDEKEQELALNSLVPLSNSDFRGIARQCVINCNDTVCLSALQLIKKIDTTFCSKISERSFDLIHSDKDFSYELKEKIIQAIHNSPVAKLEVKKYVDEIRDIITSQANSSSVPKAS